MKTFYVKDETGSGVGFASEADARYASTGEAQGLFVNELAVQFRRIACAKKGTVLPVVVVEIPDGEKIPETAQ
ncbi:hypothetical protein D3C81_1824170 [compost metagenome]